MLLEGVVVNFMMGNIQSPRIEPSALVSLTLNLCNNSWSSDGIGYEDIWSFISTSALEDLRETLWVFEEQAGKVSFSKIKVPVRGKCSNEGLHDARLRRKMTCTSV